MFLSDKGRDSSERRGVAGKYIHEGRDLTPDAVPATLQA